VSLRTLRPRTRRCPAGTDAVGRPPPLRQATAARAPPQRPIPDLRPPRRQRRIGHRARRPRAPARAGRPTDPTEYTLNASGPAPTTASGGHLTGLPPSTQPVSIASHFRAARSGPHRRPSPMIATVHARRHTAEIRAVCGTVVACQSRVVKSCGALGFAGLGAFCGVRSSTCGVRKLVRRPEGPVCSEIVFTHPTGTAARGTCRGEAHRAGEWAPLVGGQVGVLRRCASAT
jgi:hypothetical protein